MARLAGQREAKGWAIGLVAAIVLMTTATVFLQIQPPTTIVVLGPAEAADNGRPNPGLSAPGLARARSLVQVIGDLPLGGRVAAVFATRYRVSQETAEPIARHLELPVQVVDSASHEGLLERIRSDYQGQLLIVVTDVKALPGLIDGLLARATDMPAPNPDQLYIITRPRLGAGAGVALRYGEPTGGPDS